jgi:SAM-dependent methyltransferase
MGAPINSPPGADYQRSCDAFGGYWSGADRKRRRLAYSAQTKIRRFRRMLRDRGLDRKTGIAIFDHGFGAGDMLFAFPVGTEIAGVELSQSDVEAARLEAMERGFYDADLRPLEPGLPMPSGWTGRFDLLISSHVLEHIQEPTPVLRELITLLKPSGIACIIVPINERVGEDENHFHWFTEESFRTMLEDAGLVVEEVHAVDRLWRLLCPVFYLRQRHPQSIWRLLAIMQNALTAPLPVWALAAIDRVLAVAGVPPRQCFAWCRRP